jgi:hypothetical protein
MATLKENKHSLDLYILANSGLFLALSLLGFYSFQDLSWFHLIANCTFLFLAIFIFFFAASYKKILSFNLWFLLGAAVFFTIGPLLEFTKSIDRNILAITLAKVNLLNASAVFTVTLLNYFLSRKYLYSYCFNRNSFEEKKTLNQFIFVQFLVFLYIVLKLTFFVPSTSLIINGLFNKLSFLSYSFAFLYGLSKNTVPRKINKYSAIIFGLLTFLSLLSLSKLSLVSLVLGYFLGRVFYNNSIKHVSYLLIIPLISLFLFGPLCTAGRLNKYYMEDNSIMERIKIISFSSVKLLHVTFFKNSEDKYSDLFSHSMVNSPIRKLDDPDDPSFNIDPGALYAISNKFKFLGSLNRFNLVPIQIYLIDQYNLANVGRSLESLKFVLIPRIFWPDKPILSNDGVKLFYDFYPGVWAGTSSLAPSFNAEAYWNYGISGVLFISVYLALIIWLIGYLFKSFKSDFLALMFIFPFILNIFNVESWIVISYVGGIITLIVLYLFFYLFFQFLSKIKYASQ